MGNIYKQGSKKEIKKMIGKVKGGRVSVLGRC